MALSISAIIFGYTFNLSFHPVQYNGPKCMNDTPTDWQIGWTGSGHYSVFEVSIEPKFKGVHNQTLANNNFLIVPHDHA